MLGLGVQSLGLSALGTGEPELGPVEPTVTSGARFITTAGDRVIDPLTGDFARISWALQRVILALSIELGSSTADFNFGSTHPTKVDSTFESRARNSTLAALRFLIDEKAIKIIEITISFDNAQRLTRTVKFKDLSTGSEETVRNTVL